jgi:aminomethyltransferase
LTDATTPKRTPLYEAHVAAAGRIVEFAGWVMPVQYSGVIDEHRNVRERAGLFDVSHMGELRIRGPDAVDYLQRVTCNDVSRLRPGRAHYTGLTTPDGGFVDDLLVYRLDTADFLLVTNAANTAKDLAWLERHLSDLEVEVRNESSDWAQIALQGPLALEILTPHVEASLDVLKYYRFVRTSVEGVDCIVSRTGYTGEDGFEIYLPPDEALQLWDVLLATGGPRGLKPAGLGARDTLRLEAKMPLYGQDIDETTTAFEADLGWIVKLDKGDFIGRDRLLRQAREGLARKLVGFEIQGRAIARHGYSIFRSGREVGRVTSGSFAPFLEKSIGLAYLPIDISDPGSEFEVRIRNREVPARVVPTPFYKRPR